MNLSVDLLRPNLYIYMCVCVCVCAYIYIYINQQTGFPIYKE